MRAASVLRSRRLAIWASPVALTLGLSAGTVGCAVGTSADTFRPATQPGGARIHLRVDGGRVSGELLEVTDESLLVLIDATGPAATVTGGVVRVFRYPVVTILRADVDQYGRMRPRLVQDRERMRLVSRFPQGVDDELERRLLAAYGQTRAGGVVGPGGAQGERDAFLAAVRGATERYSDPDRAIADGFVAVGAESPAMGRHWVHPDRVVASVEPSRPSVLSYVDVDGDRVLAGVGFAVAGQTDRAPVIPGVPDDRWHHHSGSMEAEGHRIDHEEEAATPAGAAVAVLHVWTPIENPVDVFAPDNWSLPYVRLGLRPHPDAPISAAKALSLLNGGRGFFERQWSLSQAEPADAGRRRQLEEALRSIEGRVRAWWESRAPGPDLSRKTSDWLAAMWAELAPFGL